MPCISVTSTPISLVQLTLLITLTTLVMAEGIYIVALRRRLHNTGGRQEDLFDLFASAFTFRRFR